QSGRISEAAAVYNRILRDNPKNVDALHLLGLVAFQMSDYGESERLIAEALRLDPGQATIHHNMGSTQRVLGNFDTARQHYRTAIDKKPEYAEAYFNLAAVTKFKTAELRFISAVQKLIERSALKDPDRCFLHFAAGKYYDDLGEFDDAFRHFKAGNAIKSAAFDIEEYETLVESVIATADAEYFAARSDHGFADEAPVFIVGMPRSGTTLVEQILSSHPKIFGAGELPDIAGIIKAFPQHTPEKAPYPQCLSLAAPDTFAGFGKSYMHRLKILNNEAERIVDKNPINYQNLGLILTMLPQARIIHCSRYVLDTCLSCYFQNFRSGQEFSYSFEGIAAYYNGYRRIMDHWKSVAPERIIDMEYESVVEDLEGQSRRLIEFLGLDWNDQCLQFYESQRAIATASDMQVRQPIYKSSVRRSDKYAKHLSSLKQMLGLAD
ncbi:MAG: tetratricopeptide (TPR) repeat protein, partial [Pirellulaceae bacterium]